MSNSIQNSDRKCGLYSFGLKMPSQLNHDCVSFRATPKLLESRKNQIPMNLARQIHEIAKKDQVKIQKYMDDLLGDLLVTNYNPNNLVTILKGRSKTPKSIREKAATNTWESKEEILANMTDLNGMKIVLRDGRRSGVNAVLERFMKEIEAGNLELIEIENKRPEITKNQEFMRLFAEEKGIGQDNGKGNNKRKINKADLNQLFDYAAPETLERLRDIAEAKYPKRIVNYVIADYTKMNYPALHLLLKLPGMSRTFEVQIMGHDVALYKDLDDIIYKILNNKEVEGYGPIAKIIRPLNEPGNKAIKDAFNEYRSQVFLNQRSKDPRIRGSEEYTEYFLPLTQGIEDSRLRNMLDINNLYKLKLECDSKAKSRHKS